MWMDYDFGNGPYRPQMPVYIMCDPRPMSDQRSDKKAMRIRNFVFFISPINKTRTSLKFLTTKFLVQCYRVLLIFHRPDESGIQQQEAALL